MGETMAWECTYCPTKEQRNTKMPICHHCGSPVCKKHRKMVVDGAFSASVDPAATRVAVHCLDCQADFHPDILNMEQGTPDVQGRGAA
jgi:hypothetical protein